MTHKYDKGRNAQYKTVTFSITRHFWPIIDNQKFAGKKLRIKNSQNFTHDDKNDRKMRVLLNFHNQYRYRILR